MVTTFLGAIYEPLGFTAHVLIFAAAAFVFFQKALQSVAILQSHPNLDRRLRCVPLIEVITWSLAGLAFLAVVHVLIVVVAPQEFGAARG